MEGGEFVLNYDAISTDWHRINMASITAEVSKTISILLCNFIASECHLYYSISISIELSVAYEPSSLFGKEVDTSELHNSILLV